VIYQLQSDSYLSTFKDADQRSAFKMCKGVKWLTFNDVGYTLNNRGKNWHIDHVIPLSKFNLNDENEQQIAFNWRNTTALSPTENLKKNNKIVSSQIETHLNKLITYHRENNIEMPEKYINLFAKHLVAGSPLEPILSNK